MNFYLLSFVFYIYSFVSTNGYFKKPFHTKKGMTSSHDSSMINNNCKKHMKKVINKLRTYINDELDKQQTILEFPVDYEEKWEEGELPWDLNDNTTFATNSRNRTRGEIDPSQIAFLFI